jgi:hypothetical protein
MNLFSSRRRARPKPRYLSDDTGEWIKAAANGIGLAIFCYFSLVVFPVMLERFDSPTRPSAVSEARP